MAKYLKDHPYMEPHGLQEQQDEDDFEFEDYKESEFTPAQLSVLKNVFDKQFDKIDMDSPEISKAVYSLNKDGYINFDTGELTDSGRIILSDIYGGKYDFLKYLGGGLNEKFSKEERKKRAKKCDNPKGFTMKQFCKNQKTRSKKGMPNADAPQNGIPHIYKTIDNIDLPLYVFQNQQPQVNNKRPAIVFFFGGGWAGGSPSQFEKQCEHFAKRGMVAITVEYRVSSRHAVKIDDCIKDAKSAEMAHQILTQHFDPIFTK